MSGVKGRSGGARKGTGGARVGAGRKKKSPETESTKAVKVEGGDMLQLLQDVALGRVQSSLLQVRAAIAAVQYTHTKKGDGGIKTGKQDAAKKAEGGRFAPAAPPKLVAAGGKKV